MLQRFPIEQDTFVSDINRDMDSKCASQSP